MFKHIFVNRFKCLMREKSLVFWTLFFPVILATFFNLAFSNIDKIDKFEPIDLAVINNTTYNQDINFKTTIESLSKNDENQIFNLKYMTKEEADEALNKNKIAGYIYLNPDIKFIINKNGFNQTVVKSVIDHYLQISSLIETITEINPKAIHDGVLNEIGVESNYISSETNTNTSVVVLYFYSLIGMVCMYGSFFGLKTVTESQANLSSLGARISISPVHKAKVLMYSLFVSFVIDIIELMLILGYIIFILNISFGDNLLYVILLSIVGSIMGVTFGAIVGASNTKSENAKMGILVITSMALSFLSGLMIGDMKYIIANNAPILNYLNPVSLITDGLYSLYYYNTYNRFYLDFGLLLIFTLIFSFVTYLLIRRRKYASI